MSGTASAGAWARSLPTLETVIGLVEDQYGLKQARAVLVPSFNNDVYRVDSARRSYALKIYGVGRWTTDEVRWEQQLVRHLLNSGLGVAADVALVSGDTVGVLHAPEGDRPYALAEWVPGAKPQPPWTDDLYRTLGATLARFHDAADTLETTYPRHTVRTGAEGGEVIAMLGDDDERQGLVRLTWEAAERQLTRLADQGLRWGVRHGDPSLDNIHVSEDGLSLYDFDLAGPGWQVEDLTGALSTSYAEIFLKGYTAVRPLVPIELEALPWLRIVGTIENLHFHLIGKPAVQGTYSLAEGWVDGGFESLAAAAKKIGLTS